MAIKRCPYCRAIIDEKDLYCQNCGTQLLFPDDDAVEEDIPGDRIVDGGEEEPEAKTASDNEDVKESAPDEDRIEEAAFVEEEGGDEEKEAEVILGSLGGAEQASEAGPGGGEEDSGRSGESKEIPAPLRTEQTSDTMVKQETSEEPKTAKSDDLTFRTKELDRFMPTAELGKEKFESFLASFKDEREAEAQKAKPETSDSKAFPPWAERIKEPAGDEDARPPFAAESGRPAAESAEAPPTSPSGIGIPETLTQKPLPFGEEGRAMTEFDEREEGRREERDEERAEPFGEEAEERPFSVPPEPARDRVLRPSSRFKIRLKAKVFDLVFIAVFWGLAVWLAARSMEVSLFRLVGAAALSVGLFYLVLLVSYWALFYFFLGETFGDRLFAFSEE
jgi:hypothetical protein